MIPLPWGAIAFLVWTALASGVCYLKGGEHARNAMLAASAEASDRAIRRFNAYTREDIEAARQAAERAGRQQIAAQQIRHRFDLEASRNAILQTIPAPGAPGEPAAPPAAAGPVQLSAGGIRVLNDAIAGYNAHAQPASGSRDPVPPDAAPRPRDPGGGDGPARTAGRDLRISYVMRLDAPRGGGVAAAAD